MKSLERFQKLNKITSWKGGLTMETLKFGISNDVTIVNNENISHGVWNILCHVQ